MLDDIRYAFRSLIRSPGFTAAAVLTLALGIGAAATMFDLVIAYYLRPPAGVIDADALVSVRSVVGGQVMDQTTFLDFRDFRAGSRSFSGVMAYLPTTLDLGRGEAARRVPAAVVSSNYFGVLGVKAARGRTFLPDEELPAAAHPVAVISDRLWRTDFGGDPGVVGRDVVLNGRSLTIVGVAPRGFHGHAESFDVWLPLAMSAGTHLDGLVSLDNRVWRWLTLVARLKPGVSLTQARAEAAITARQLERAGAGEGKPFGLALDPVRPSILRDSFALLLMGGVAVLFLVVCANLSNLFVARAGERRKEIATRLALGATRLRLVRRLLTETVALGLLGGLLGLLVAPAVARGVLAWSSAATDTAGADGLGTSWALAGFVLGISVLAGVALGLGPALRVTGLDVAASLREGIGGRSAGRTRTRGALVIAQLGLSLALLSAGGLFVTTLRAYRSLLLIPQPERVLLVHVQPWRQGYDVARARVYFGQLQERVQGLPGVTAATVARDVNTSDASFFDEAVAAGTAKVGAEATLNSGYNVIAPAYFRTMGLRLVSGRDFTPQDGEGAPPVVIVNATLARRLWPAGDPLGQTLQIKGEPAARTVVGLAADRPTREGLRPFLYYPLSQLYPWPGSAHVLLVRTTGDPLALLPAARREAASVDAALPLFDPRTLERVIAGDRFFERIAGAILGGSGVFALLLAVIGLYGIVGHWVAQRTHEIGVRMALGARAGDVVSEVVGRAMRLALGGVGIGLAAAVVVNRICAAWLFRAQAAEPVVLAAAGLLLLLATFLASYFPARRASRVDPIVVLRCE